ncbi:MAG: S-adenosyl-methyltransferase [Flavobacterium sp.]|nr:S-adenosyl-methyltransferase [Candidatus Neoflavobacterium equi]
MVKENFYNLLKAKYLSEDGALEKWQFILFLLLLAIIMIANSHRYEKKVYEISALTTEVKQLRSEFVDTRSELMELKMESTISQKMELIEVFPSEVPPLKIKVNKQDENIFKRLWQ